MAGRLLHQRIDDALSRAGLTLPREGVDGLERYLTLLAAWNRRINLTALPVDPPDDAALERLVVEPLVGSRSVGPEHRLAVDLGSGGGSPAVPVKIACGWLRFVLVESRGRKCAFLREVVRQLRLDDVEVVQERFEAVAERPDLAGRVDLVTFRAVRADASLWSTVATLLAPRGLVLWFGAPEQPVLPAGFGIRAVGSAASVVERQV